MTIRAAALSFLILIKSGICFCQSELIPFTEDGKTGLKNKAGIIIIPAEYENLGWSDGSFSVIRETTGYKKSGAWGLLQLNQNRTTKAQYTSLIPAGKGLLIATKQINQVIEKTGCIDLQDKVVVNFEYEALKISDNQLIAILKQNNQYLYGILDLNGYYILKPEWKSIIKKSEAVWISESVTGQFYLFNKQGERLLNQAIDSLGNFVKSYAIIYAKSFRGLIHENGKIIHTPVFKSIKLTENELPTGQRYDEWRIITRDNKTIQLIEADSIKDFSENKLRLYRNQFTDLVERANPASILLTADSIGPLIQGYACLAAADKFGLMDSLGKITIAPKYSTITNLGSVWLFSNNQSGNTSYFILNTKKPASIKGTWSEIIPGGNFFKIRKQGYAGVIDKNGTEIIAPVYDSIFQITSQLLSVRMLGKYGIINFKEEWIIYPQADVIELINDSLYFQRGKTITYLRKLRSDLIYFTSNKIKSVDDHLEELMPDGEIKKVSFYGVEIHEEITNNDSKSTKLAPIILPAMFPVTENLQGFFENGKYGFKDEKGRIRIANRYDSIVPFSESKAAVKLLGKWGFIDQYDKLIIQPQFDKPAYFKNHFAHVLKNGYYGIIDNNGTTRLNFEYEILEPVHGQPYQIVKKDSLSGLCSNDGTLLIEPRFEHIEYIGNDEVLVKKNRSGVITTKGLPVIPLIYNELKFLSVNDLFLSRKKPEPENLIR